MKSISHGVLIFNGDAQLLLCHATDSPYWDIPKGGGTLTEEMDACRWAGSTSCRNGARRAWSPC